MKHKFAAVSIDPEKNIKKLKRELVSLENEGPRDIQIFHNVMTKRITQFISQNMNGRGLLIKNKLWLHFMIFLSCDASTRPAKLFP